MDVIEARMWSWGADPVGVCHITMLFRRCGYECTHGCVMARLWDLPMEHVTSKLIMYCIYHVYGALLLL